MEQREASKRELEVEERAPRGGDGFGRGREASEVDAMIARALLLVT